MKLVSILSVTLSLGLVAPQNLLHSLVPFIDEAFRHSIRELCLAGLEQREVFEDLVALPYPKTILGGNITFRKLEESHLIILFADVRSWSTLVESIQMKFMTKGWTLWQANILVLVEDQYLERRATMSMLSQFFRHFGIGFWCVTSERRGTYVRYILDLSIQGVMLDGPMDFRTLYTYRRLIINHTLPIRYQAFTSFPYTFRDERNLLNGIDIYLYKKLFEYLHLRDVFHLDKNKAQTGKDLIQMIMENLISKKVDVTLTRRQIETTLLPMIVLPEPMVISLVVPRRTTPAFLRILWRPFSDELWISIALSLAFAHGVKLLTKIRTKMGRNIRRYLKNHLMDTFISLTVDVVSFVLIESYLAQVTSFLLVHQFQRDPETLAEFFATNIPVQVMEQQKLMVSSLEPRISAALLTRAEVVPMLDEYSTTYAHIDTMARASFMLAAYTKHDESGRKPLFILPEPLGTVPTAYLFSPIANPLRTHMALHLSWMSAFGFMVEADRLYNNLLQYVLRRASLGEDLLQLDNLKPIGILLLIGWVTGAIVLFDRI
ncbi:hypothetical protein ZHAS_00004608 [Anopheles sinensis]|uniref:Ionotropic receptor n=1 Tax=Anopheles sinensis TaxID=74873 RepID=A0A084VH76_ANOSI|nr:hypothetical protein ZHAS_00004608 [Anopheles sinensis]